MRTSRPALFTALTAMALIGAFPAPASAVVTSSVFESERWTLSGNADDDDITPACTAGQIDPAPVSPAQCSDITEITVRPGDGTDTADLSGITAAVFPNVSRIFLDTDDDNVFTPEEFTGSPLDDYVQADFRDVVRTGTGDDIVEGGATVDLGPGDDVVFESGSEGNLQGGPGDDRFIDSLANGGNTGGDGYDSFHVDFDKLGSPFIGDLAFRLSDDVLQLDASDGASSLSQSFVVSGFEVARVFLPRGIGDQRFDGSDFPGRLELYGGPGPDTLIGSSTFDILDGGADADVINSRDGGLDFVRCGDGNDRAIADQADVVIGCERVDLPKPQTRKITGPKKIAKGKKGTYRFGATISGSVFQCKIDKQRWRGCSSPYRVNTKRLKKGKHVLRVRAGAPAGNWDATPAKKNFRVTKKK